LGLFEQNTKPVPSGDLVFVQGRKNMPYFRFERKVLMENGLVWQKYRVFWLKRNLKIFWKPAY